MTIPGEDQPSEIPRTQNNEPKKSFPPWAALAGFVFLSVTTLFFMALVFLPATLTCGKRGIIVFILALTTAAATGFLSGDATAQGKIPFFADSPLAVAVTGAIASLVILMVLGFKIYASDDPCGGTQSRLAASECHYVFFSPLHDPSDSGKTNYRAMVSDKQAYLADTRSLEPSTLIFKGFPPVPTSFEVLLLNASPGGGYGRLESSFPLAFDKSIKYFVVTEINYMTGTLRISPITEWEAARETTMRTPVPNCSYTALGLTWQ